MTNGSGQQDILIFNTKQPASATNPVNLTTGGTTNEGKPVWSPDGSTIYYSRSPTSMADATHGIFSEPSNNTGHRPRSSPTTRSTRPARALADGTQLCYTRGPFGTRTLMST